MLRGADHAMLDYIEVVARHGLEWLAEHLPVEPEGKDRQPDRTWRGSDSDPAVGSE